MAKLTKAQRRCLEKLGAERIVGCSWGHTYKPPICLVRAALARQDGYLHGRPFYKITDAGRGLLSASASETPAKQSGMNQKPVPHHLKGEEDR